jgi:hypothetical protein
VVNSSTPILVNPSEPFDNQPMVIERSVEITDERGTVVLSVAFESAIAW